MLLFSTLLDINDTLSKDDFIKLILEWNQSSPHENNIIKGITWNGERNIRYSDENRWLDIEEYRNKNIIAVRYEKKDENGIVWDTNYVMNFNKMKMAVRLDRSYTEDAMTIDSKFSTPHFITLLIERGYIKKDRDLPVLRTPILINDSNMDMLADIINGKVRYRLPIVYISKTFYDEDPVNTKLLAGRLKGVAHVLVQETNCTNRKLRSLCDGKNEYYGAIGIYNALLRDRLLCQKQERTMAENERRKALYELLELKENLDRKQESMQEKALAEAKLEADKILDGFEEEMRSLKDDVTRLTRENEKLVYENMGLKTKLDSNMAVPFLFMGNEEDFYQGEIKDFVLSAVKKELAGTQPKTRRYDVLMDVMEANDYQAIGEKRADEIKKLLSNYNGMTPKIRRGLEDIGFVFDTSDHQKVKYYGDGRYTLIYASTPSDKGHGGRNNVSRTNKKVF